MSIPGNINTAPPPSSFDDDPDFFEESRWQKLKRRLTEEPLIPLGCALTCWALFEASRSIRSGDRHRTNRMFRRRIYAQGFTVLAMLAGSAYWESDRGRRQEYQGLLDEKKKKERHDAWIRELEVREQEEEELRRVRNKILNGQATERRKLLENKKDSSSSESPGGDGQSSGSWSSVRSVVEVAERRRRPVTTALLELMNRK